MALRPSSARYRCRVVAREGGACVPGHEGVRQWVRDIDEVLLTSAWNCQRSVTSAIDSLRSVGSATWQSKRSRDRVAIRLRGGVEKWWWSGEMARRLGF